MSKNEVTLAKIYEQADGERAAGNIAAANNHEAKAAKFAKKHDLPQRQQSAVAEEKREFEEWLDRQPDSMQVIVWVQEPGMKRLVQRIKPMGAVRSEIKRLPGCLARPLPPPKPFRGTSPDGHNPLPPPMSNEALAQLRARAKSGTGYADGDFTPHATEDRGRPYVAEGKRWWHGLFFD